ncbi:MAG: glycosyltransferase family 4 protein [Candidatus Pacebacteria bacterium]|nr:glycosyltransferase family 4 protein [Candidatus Paceibacterota bacterium]
MKILILNHNQERFGTYWRCLNIGRSLVSRGYRVTLICASGEKFDLLMRKKEIEKDFRLITLPRICYHQYFTGQMLLRFPFYLGFVLLGNYDLLYTFAVAQPQMALPAIAGKLLARKKLIIDWDDPWGQGFAEEHGGLVERVLTFFERWTLKYADRITYVSEWIGKEIKRLGFSKIATKIPNGANIAQINVLGKKASRQELGLDLDKKYLLSVGNTYTDSLGTMLEAFRLVSAKNKKAFLLMVGIVEVPKKFRKIWQKVKQKIILTGSRPFVEIPKYLAAADCLLLPMDDSNIEKARFPMRFGDYLCAQRPIVSNAVGEVKYYLEKYQAGLTSQPDSAPELALNIEKVLKDKKLAAKVSKNARRLAEGDLSWQKVIDDLEKVLFGLKKKAS